MTNLHALLEALLFAAQTPLSSVEIVDLLEGYTESDWSVIEEALRELQTTYSGDGRGIHLANVAGGWQFRTNPDCNRVVLKLYQEKPQRLSRAAIETLAIIAYRQPIVRAEIDEIRGVDSGGVLRKLQEFQLVKVVGRLDEVGRPLLYGTSDLFLSTFGLHSLEELPPLDDFKVESLEMLGDDLSSLAEEMALERL